MIRGGRPLRFVVLLSGGWIAMRTLQLWPAAGPIPTIVAAIAPAASAMIAPTQPGVRVDAPTVDAMPVARFAATRTFRRAAAFLPVAAAPAERKPDAVRIALALAALVRFGPAQPIPDAPPSGARAIDPPTIVPVAPRLSGSGWMIARGSGTTAAFAPQLGGSQAGARLTYALGDSRRVAVAARFSSALDMRQREAAVGLDWRPTSLPVHIVAEQRIGVENARGGPAVGLIGGIAPTPVAAGFRLEGYGQAGAIARGGVEGYADGSLRLARALATVGAAELDLGLGAWGGAQRGAARLDVGPSASLRVPAAGRTLRLSLDWRQRIAGTARPASGPALSIGTDF